MVRKIMIRRIEPIDFTLREPHDFVPGADGSAVCRCGKDIGEHAGMTVKKLMTRAELRKLYPGARRTRNKLTKP